MHYQQQQNYCILMTSGTKGNTLFITSLKTQSVEVKDKNIFLCLSTKKEAAKEHKRDRLR